MAKTSLFLALTSVLLWLSVSVHAQTVVTLGDNTINSIDVPVFSGTFGQNGLVKSNMVITAEELQDLGLAAGEFTGMSFNLTQGEGIIVEGFTIRVDETSGAFTDTEFRTADELIFGPQDLAPTLGWFSIEFDQVYVWDGFSDILFETCFEDRNGFGPFSIWFGFTTDPQYLENRDFDPVCDETEGEQLLFARPNIQLTWQPNPVPPEAAFSIGQVSSCSGEVTFQDESIGVVDEWLWYFGDGNTSMDPNPFHQYEVSGDYDVSLVVSNEFGSDSIGIVEAVSVVVEGAIPVAASCTPQTLDQELGFGPTQVSLNGTLVSSEDGSVGYESLICEQFEIQQGLSYILSVSVEGPFDQAVAAWIDYNADGIFTESEQILSGSTPDNSTIAQEFTPPADALTDSVLRMRVIADFALLGEPDPCADMDGGQAEDHSVRIIPNITPPVAGFSVDPSISCDGVVQFQDLSSFIPDSWIWQFGDGEFSTDQNPEHTYTESGFYTVSLTVQNEFGQDEITIEDVITIDLESALTPACAVTTTEYCCGYGLLTVEVNDFINTSEDGIEGYVDYSCTIGTSVTEGVPFEFSANTGTDNPHDVLVYIDFNDDGSFEESELVFFSNNANVHGGFITIPFGSPVTDSRLRMRVIGDFVGNGNNGCTDAQFGQIEDYAITILPDLTPPAADFSSDAGLSCDGIVSFTNESSSNSEGFLWYFGDGVTSMDIDPVHTYLSSGIYTVSLVATNGNGQDSIAFEDLVTVDFDAICDTLSIPTSGTDGATACNGVLADDGGPDGDYSNDSDSQFTITSADGTQITLEFSEFQFQTNIDFLRIYDGPDDSSPIIGSYTGFNLPNGGSITSSGNSVTLVQSTNFFGNFDGFLLEWSCQPLSIEELDPNLFSIWPNPNQGLVNIDLPKGFNGTLRIIDSSGRMLLEQGINAPTLLDLSDLAEGRYLMQFLTQDALYTESFLLTR